MRIRELRKSPLGKEGNSPLVKNRHLYSGGDHHTARRLATSDGNHRQARRETMVHNERWKGLAFLITVALAVAGLAVTASAAPIPKDTVVTSYADNNGA